jgi:tRNA A37 methylthiotransferase MiaB
VGETREVLVVEPGTGESVKAYDDAYRQIAIADAQSRGLEPGQFVEVEVVESRTHYAMGEPV